MNKVNLILLIAATAAIAGGISQLPDHVEHRTNSLGDAMINKFKRAYPSYSANQYKNAASICDYASKYITSQNQLAYVLATAVGESNMTPIKEYRANEGSELWYIQNKYWYTGYYGRGYVQLTWDFNYRQFGDLLGIPLLKNPDLALDPTYAAQIIVRGMKDGKFTGVGLDDYINSSRTDFYNARKIVNGLDAAARFEEYCNKIVRA